MEEINETKYLQQLDQTQELPILTLGFHFHLPVEEYRFQGQLKEDDKN